MLTLVPFVGFTEVTVNRLQIAQDIFQFFPPSKQGTLFPFVKGKELVVGVRTP